MIINFALVDKEEVNLLHCLNTFTKLKEKDVCQVHMTIVHLLILAVSIALTVAYIMTEHWILGDLFATCLITNIVGFITVDSFWAGLILMCGVLLHDFMWISGSETIINISESFSGAPTNIVWPRNIETFVLNRLVQENQLFTMLSIIDIIIPGRKINRALLLL